MAQINTSLELYSMIITALLITGCAVKKTQKSRSNRIFIWMLALNFAVLLCDALTWILEYRAEYTVLLYVLNFLVYSLGYVMTALFTQYLVKHIAERAKISIWIGRIINILCAVAVLLVVVSLFNHMYFCFDDGIYIRGPLFWMSQVFPAIIMAIDMIIVICFHKQLGINDTLALLLYGVLPAAAMLVQIAVYGITLLYLATTLSLFVIYIVIYVEQDRILMQKETELTQSRISVMLSQIQPHFLYNTLSTIAFLCRTEPALAERASIEFSEFLRGNMESLTAEKPISFEQELEHTRHYLSLEKLRFENGLNIVLDIKTSAFRLPTLTLQPIVENAVRYGVTKRPKGGTVTISTEEHKDAFTVSVVDDGVGFDTSILQANDDSHVGIKNARERLERMCGGTLDISSARDVGTIVIITIPKEK